MNFRLTPPDPLLTFAVISMLLNLIGIIISFRLVIEAWKDKFALTVLKVDSFRHLSAAYFLRAEITRCGIQIGMLAGSVPGFFIAPERYSSIINDLWPLILYGSLLRIVMSGGLAVNSVDGYRTRRKILAGVIGGEVKDLKIEKKKG